MDFINFIGIDISKQTFDFALIRLDDPSNAVSDQASNNPSGLVRLQEFIKRQHLEMDKTLFCMEHTGVYCRMLSGYLTENHYHVWLEMPVQIIRSLGLQRGKNDRIDAVRIARYALMKRESAVLWQPPKEVLVQINDLLTLRERLIGSHKSLQQPIKELRDAGFHDSAKLIESKCSSSLRALEKEIAQIEKDLDQLINKDSNLKRLYKLAISVSGIGKITALTLLYFTNGFTMYTSANQLSCYCGIAPFEYSSGTTVRGRTRVSHFANKRLKTLLHLAAMTAILCDREISQYYHRKVDQGKNKMLVINAIRNKILHRLCAVINRGTTYQKEYQLA
ncbi:MAG: IS110 family transposase [Candidatus Saccharibacteria bacterium]